MELDEMLGMAVRHLDQRETKQSLALINEAIERYPSDHRPWQLRGGLRQMTGNYREALDDLEHAWSLCPLCPAGQLALAECYRRAGKRVEAIDLARRLAAAPGIMIGILSQISCLLGCLGEFDDALEVCERIVALQEEAHPAWFGIGFYRARLGFRPNQILPFIERALKLEPTSVLYRANAGLLRIRAGRIEDGLAALALFSPQTLRCPSVIQAIANALRAHQVDASDWIRRLQELEHQRMGRRHSTVARRASGCCLCLPAEQIEG